MFFSNISESRWFIAWKIDVTTYTRSAYATIGAVAGALLPLQLQMVNYLRQNTCIRYPVT